MTVDLQRFLLLILFLVLLALIARWAPRHLWLIVIGAIFCVAFVTTGQVYR